MTHTTVTAHLAVAGMHSWPDAVPAVRFLAAPHRHKFHIRVTVPVDDDNRQTEFFLLQRAIRAAVHHNYEADDLTFDFRTHSCEMIARRIGEHIRKTDPVLSVRVSEDDENEACVTWEIA